MPRRPQPEDLTRLRVPTDPRLSPDGRWVAFTVQVPAPRHDGYRSSLWLAPADASEPARQVTIGFRHDAHARFSPDGRTLAFLSDRRIAVEEEPGLTADPKEREDAVQVHLLSLDGGEAHRVTNLPRGVDGFAWSPDGSRLLVSSSSRGATRDEDARLRGKDLTPEPGSPPESDYRYLDRLGYMLNGAGFVDDKVSQLWLVDLQSDAVRRLTDGPVSAEQPAWSPDGGRIAFGTDRRRDHDLRFRRDLYVVDVDNGQETRVSGGDDAVFGTPTWLPDGETIACLGGRLPDNAYRNDIWLFPADGSDAEPGGGRNLSGKHDLMPGAMMNSDVTPTEETRLLASDDGASIAFLAPVDGSYELWRIATGDGRVRRVTEDRHYVSSFDQVGVGGRTRVAHVRSTPTLAPEVYVVDLDARGRAGEPRRVSALNDELLSEVNLLEPVERRWTVDGREIQGWLLPGGRGRRPLVVEIHGGPHTLYGWAPSWEFQVLAANGISVLYCNPRGSEGYGRAFNEANLGDWGDGPMADVLAGVDAVVADRLADPERLGVTGGSYGGYLTNWIIGHDRRFRTAITCRSVSDMGLLFLTGDISGGEWAELEFGVTPWADPEYFRSISPIRYAERIRTPLLIQHSEQDLRTTVAQAELLFTVLRSHKRQVRMMRVPEENHDLTRAGTPFRRVENLRQVRDWFRHYLVDGKRGLPSLPKERAGR